MKPHPLYRLADVADVVAGDPAPRDPEAFAPDGPLFVRMQDVGSHHLNRALSASADRLDSDWLAKNRLRLFPRDSIPIPKSDASVNLNHRAELAADAYVVSHLAIVIPDRAKVDPDYLFWWSVRYDPRAQVQVTSLPSLKLATLKEAEISLPPMQEQRRIAGILNRAARTEQLRARAAACLHEFIPTLFIEMFGDPVENPMGWETAPLGACRVLTQYGTSMKANDRSEGVPVLRMGNVTYAGYLNCTDLKHVEFTETDTKKYALHAGDVLFNRTNSRELVGKTGIWDGRFKAVAASYFVRLKVNETVLCPVHVWAFMNTSAMKHRLYRTARGAIGQANINTKELKSLPLPVPPLDRQRRYAEIIETARDVTSTAETASKSASALSISLMARLL